MKARFLGKNYVIFDIQTSFLFNVIIFDWRAINFSKKSKKSMLNQKLTFDHVLTFFLKELENC